MSATERLTQFITVELLSDRGLMTLNGDDNLLTSGLIDSLAIMRLVNFIENEFDVEVMPEDVTIENFQTVNVIANYVQQRAV